MHNKTEWFYQLSALIEERKKNRDKVVWLINEDNFRKIFGDDADDIIDN